MSVPTFTFSTDSYPTEFRVVSFTGEEQMSHLFEYEIDLRISTLIDYQALIGENAVFTFHSNHSAGRDEPVRGILSSVQGLSDIGDFYLRVKLVPKVWEGNLSLDHEIFVDKTPRQIITEEVTDAGLSSLISTTEISSSTTDSPNISKSFTCQYNESDFCFISRIAEHHGIYYYFDHSDDSKLVFADHKDYPDRNMASLIYDAGAIGTRYFDRVNHITSRVHIVPSQVTVTGYDPNQPSYAITKTAWNPSYKAGSRIVLNMENVTTSEEAQYIAQVRLDEILCMQYIYVGKSGIVGLRPGYTVKTPPEMIRGKTEGLVVAVKHKGNNLDSSPTNSSGYYENEFTIIDSDTQYRPQRITPKPQATSTSGTVYSEAGDARRAEVNSNGEYRVKFNFLIGDVDPETGVGKVSSWLRRATPTAGTEDGMDIPLKGGVEVLIGFEGGNPDKPYIQNAMPNAAFPAHVTDANAHNALIATSGLLGLKANGGWYRNIHVDEADWNNPVFGAEAHTFNIMINDPATNTVSVGTEMTEVDEMSGNYIINRLYGDQYTWADGINYEWDNKPTYSFGNGYDEFHESDQMESIQTESFPLPWMPDGKEDREDGHIEKVWGDKFEFHEGRVYAWSGGSGPGGSLQTFNYGNGYTENLLETDRGTSADLDFEKLEYDDYTEYPEIDVTKSTIEKTFGATYSYQNGFSADIKVGDSHSKTFGNSYSTVWGNDRSQIHGNQYEDIYGNCESHHLGTWNKEVFTGTKGEYMFGASTEMFIAAKNEMRLAGTLNLAAAIDIDIALSMKNEIHLGTDFAFQAAGFMKLTTGFGFDLTGGKIAEKKMEMELTGLKTIFSNLFVIG